MGSKLGKIEIRLYFFLWILANLYSLYKLYEVQTKLISKYSSSEFKLKELQPGWDILHRFRDVADFEWSLWKYLVSLSWHFVIVHSIISESIRVFKPSLLKYWYIIESVIYINTLFGVRHLLAIIAQPTIFLAIIFSGGGKICIWLSCIFIFITLGNLESKIEFWDFFSHEEMEDEKIYLLLTGLAWTSLRCLSFSIDYIVEKQKNASICKEMKQQRRFKDIVNIFSYVLYLPSLYSGPIIMYEKFDKSFFVRNSMNLKLKYFFKDLSVYILYGFLLDLALHYIYFIAMQDDIELIRKMPCMALCGGGLWMGLQFHMKYVILYGTVGAFARLDNIDPPPTPRCIARIHVYSQMWRYFDVGLYMFLIKYAYKPVMEILSTINMLSTFIRRLIASLSTFLFVFIWHGSTYPILIWAGLNYIGITLEQVGGAIMTTKSYKTFKTKLLQSDRMEERFKALVCAPLFAMSAISSFYLFGGYEIGHLFFEYVSHPSLSNVLIILFSLYSGCHVSVALQQVPSRTDKRKVKN